jgi:hypothetical protein
MRWAPCAIAVLGAVLATGCGGGGDDARPTSAGTPARTAPPPPVARQVRDALRGALRIHLPTGRPGPTLGRPLPPSRDVVIAPLPAATMVWGAGIRLPR